LSRIGASTITIKINGTDEVTGDDFEEEHELPAKNEVCYRCEGYGTHLNPNIGEHAYTREEFDEAFDDEGKEEYFKRGGIYDVACEECHGNKVILVVDEDKLNAEQKRVFELWEEQQDEYARWDAEDRHTRRMESGGWDY